MTTTIQPDRRWLTKQFLIVGTISALLVGAAGLVHLILSLAIEDADDLSLGVTITWIVIGGLVVLMWLVTVPAVMLWFRNLQYVIEDDKVIIRKGILTKTQQNIPMGMVTDFRLQRTLFDRMLGLGSILVQTAGQGVTATGYEGKLGGLEAWDDLHEDLRRRIRPGERRPRRGDEDAELRAILEELRSIRRLLESGR